MNPHPTPIVAQSKIPGIKRPHGYFKCPRRMFLVHIADTVAEPAQIRLLESFGIFKAIHVVICTRTDLYTDTFVKEI